jgi:phosphoenolpyruvate carboxykinase (GTP)
MKPMLEGLMRGASASKTMYVVPYLMAAAGSPIEAYAAGVGLTDHRTVVLHMIRGRPAHDPALRLVLGR